jgi:protein-S-isoprenylcysteine O-methyltransferase Ste14
MILFINPTIISFITGFLLAISGEIIRIWAVSYAGSETRTTSGAGGSYLVTQGPYSILRNPLYLGNIIIYTGIGIMSNSLFPYLQIAAIFYFSIQYYCIILIEEEYLETAFRNEYEIYRKNINKFIPSFKPVPQEIRSKLGFNLKKGIISEKRSLHAFGLTTLIILFFLLTNYRIIKL